MSTKASIDEIPLLTGRAIDQVGILVPDLEAAVRSHRASWQGIGWNLWEYDASMLTSVTYRGTPTSSAAWRAALNTATPQIELIQPVTGPSIYDEWIEERGYGLHHLGVVVASVDGAIEQMAAVGLEVIQAGRGFGLDGDGGFAYFDTLDEFGFLVEAITRPLRRREPFASFAEDDAPTA